MYPIIRIPWDKGQNYKSLSGTFFFPLFWAFYGAAVGKCLWGSPKPGHVANRAWRPPLRAAGLCHLEGPKEHPLASSWGLNKLIQSQLWLYLTLTQQPNSDLYLTFFFFPERVTLWGKLFLVGKNYIDTFIFHYNSTQKLKWYLLFIYLFLSDKHIEGSKWQLPQSAWQPH